MRCSMAGCHSDNQSKHFRNGYKFFRFPNEVNVQKEWVIACKRSDKFNVKNARMCSKHFDENSYFRNLKYELLGLIAQKQRLLKPDAIPSLNLPVVKGVEKSVYRKSSIDRRRRSELVQNKNGLSPSVITSNDKIDEPMFSEVMKQEIVEMPDLVKIETGFHGSTTDSDENVNEDSKLLMVQFLKDKGKVYPGEEYMQICDRGLVKEEVEDEFHRYIKTEYNPAEGSL